jgi:hypothetical protein
MDDKDQQKQDKVIAKVQRELLRQGILTRQEKVPHGILIRVIGFGEDKTPKETPKFWDVDGNEYID